MAYKVIILYRLYMPSHFLGIFAEYPFDSRWRQSGAVYFSGILVCRTVFSFFFIF